MQTTIKIIFVDDDPRQILQQQDIIYKNGFDQVSYFKDPEEMLYYLEELEDNELPVVLVTDLNKPLISCFELIRSLKTNPLYDSIAILVSSTSSLSKYLYLFQRNYFVPGLA